jgi:hypothetical protein
MKHCWSPVVAAITAAALPATAGAEEMRTAPATCTAPKVPTGELAAWTTPRPLNAAQSAGRLSAARLVPGQAVEVALAQTADVKYPLRPEKPGEAASYGGLIGLNIREAGTYRVALGSGAWIDVVGKDGKAVASIGHGHGPECAGVRKMVDFPLKPGRYTLQISASGATAIRVLLARLP